MCLLLKYMRADSCLPSDHRRIRLSGPREIKNEGAVQLCVRYNGRDYLWTYITISGWTNAAAAVACRELGFTSTGEKSRYLTRNNLFLHVDIVRANVRLWESALTIATRVRCNGRENTLRECFSERLRESYYDRVAGLICSRLFAMKSLPFMHT